MTDLPGGLKSPRAPWMARAACLGQDPAVWFPGEQPIAAAQAICAGCAVRTACLEYALENRIEHGVWGGCSERERRRILRARRVARRQRTDPTNPVLTVLKGER
jgi:WhiB family redox-sensing transcriptional regulator